MKTHIALALATALVTPATAVALEPQAPAHTWELDAAHTNARFSVKHMMVSTVQGEFKKVSATVKLDEKDFTRSTLEATIDAASIDTRVGKRDEHLRSADFFDVASHPEITFKSTKIARAGKGRYKMTGDLTIRGNTRPVTFDVVGFDDAQQSPWGAAVRGGQATAKIDRKDFGLVWNKPLGKAGGLLVGDEVTITLDVELARK